MNENMNATQKFRREYRDRRRTYRNVGENVNPLRRKRINPLVERNSSNQKETLMKHVARSICLAAFCAGTVLAEYEILLRLGGVFVALATAFALAVVSGALYRAPEADERAHGLHVDSVIGPPGFLRRIRPFQRQMRRGWT